MSLMGHLGVTGVTLVTTGTHTQRCSRRVEENVSVAESNTLFLFRNNVKPWHIPFTPHYNSIPCSSLYRDELLVTMGDVGLAVAKGHFDEYRCDTDAAVLWVFSVWTYSIFMHLFCCYVSWYTSAACQITCRRTKLWPRLAVITLGKT